MARYSAVALKFYTRFYSITGFDILCMLKIVAAIGSYNPLNILCSYAIGLNILCDQIYPTQTGEYLDW